MHLTVRTTTTWMSLVQVYYPAKENKFTQRKEHRGLNLFTIRMRHVKGIFVLMRMSLIVNVMHFVAALPLVLIGSGYLLVMAD